MEQAPRIEQKWLTLADELNKLQAPEVGGKGLPFVRYIIRHLQIGDIQSARNSVWTESDKFRSLPEIKKLLTEVLFEGEEKYPWKTSDEFEKRLIRNLPLAKLSQAAATGKALALTGSNSD